MLAWAPPFLHAIYLINLGNPKPDNIEKSVTSLVNYMNLAEQIGAGGVIFHPGSHGGAGYDGIFQQVVDSITQVLEQTPEGPLLCLENMAGMGQHIGAKFSELGDLLRAVDSPRLGICLDTQHAFAAGYDLTNPEGVAGMIDEFDRDIGLDRLAAVHANDSSGPAAPGLIATTTSVRASSASRDSKTSCPIPPLPTCPSSWKCRDSERSAGVPTNPTWTS